MRKLKIRLQDDNVYEFRTLPFSKMLAVRKQAVGDKKMNRFVVLQEKEKKSEDGLSVEELNELRELEEYIDSTEDKTLEELVRVARISISGKHVEFGFQGEEAKDKEVSDKIQDLMDMHSMMLVFQFAMTGSVATEKEEIEIKETIDLTK